MFEFPLSVPTCTKGEWSTRTFHTKESFISFVESQFKLPGKYNLRNTYKWKESYNTYVREGEFTSKVKGSYEYRKYWQTEKERCLKGVIFDGVYCPPFHYTYLNFFPIWHKRLKKYITPDVWDTDLHTYLYLTLCILKGKHALILKTRQRGFSFKFAAVLYWSYMWFEGSINTIGAFDIKFVRKTWKFLEKYRNFCNTKTAWRRGPVMPKALDWEEKTLTEDNDIVGLQSILKGVTFKQSASNDVGGSQTFFFYEEAGIAPTIEQTIGYIRNAIEDGDLITGTIIISGSVGDLDMCDGLKKYMKNPASENFLAVDNVYDDLNFPEKIGLFIPDEWSLGGYIDSEGNSLVEEAKKFIAQRDIDNKRRQSGEQYKLYKSQNPSKPSEAFDYRKDSPFPLHLISQQLNRIQIDKHYFLEYLDINRDMNGKLSFKSSPRLPIKDFPIKKEMEDKRGCLVVHERPVEGAPWGTYYASIDPVGEGKTVSSDSLVALYIYKNPIQVNSVDIEGKPQTHIERDKLVAWWCGRYDNINDTHEFLENAIEMYQAWTLVENNVSLFIQYLIEKKKHRYLVPKNQMLFIKDLSGNSNVFQEWGWKNVGTLFKTQLLSYGIEFMKEVLDQDVLPDGTIVRQTYGIDRIPDEMLLREAVEYHDKLNVDRLVAYCSLVAFAKVQQSNRGILKATEQKTNLEKSENLYKLSHNPFRNFGRISAAKRRSPFKHF